MMSVVNINNLVPVIIQSFKNTVPQGGDINAHYKTIEKAIERWKQLVYTKFTQIPLGCLLS